VHICARCLIFAANPFVSFFRISFDGDIDSALPQEVDDFTCQYHRSTTNITGARHVDARRACNTGNAIEFGVGAFRPRHLGGRVFLLGRPARHALLGVDRTEFDQLPLLIAQYNAFG
jgi:hypothetical protein